MSGTDMAAAPGGGSNASEFVRKLYRMLEDPSHQDVARWGKVGDTFVVVEGEKFTRSILPKHFKHSNMSSFIRQLNKYDFHKVKPSGDGDNSSPLGNVLEFKHPHFRIDSKDDLDNIRRKAPAPRKPQVAEDFTTSHHISAISEQLAATQQQVQQLQELYTEVSQTNKVLVSEVLNLQKVLTMQNQASHEVLNYLTPYNDGPSNNLVSQPMVSNGQGNDSEEPVPELRRARELLTSINTETVAERELDRLQHVYSSPADSGAMVTPTSLALMNDPMHDISRYPVYPVGQTVGIDPFHSDHIHKIPYAVPNDVHSSGMVDQPQSSHSKNAPSGSAASSGDKSESIWGSRKPQVLLVEDDPTCTKIGVKFLKSMGCEVSHAPNGAEAYARMNDNTSRDQFDLIFMDIIMPRLDGVSATMYIRQTHPTIPIIAMTSNIRPEEVNGYFEHGMNGVLAKPFARDGLWKSVRSHLGHLMRTPPAENDTGSAAGYFPLGMSYVNTSGAVKFESQTPAAGPGGANWPPGQMGQNSMGGGLDQGYGFINGSTQYGMGAAPRSMYSPNMPSADSSSGRLSDVDSPPEKRQRTNPQSSY